MNIRIFAILLGLLSAGSIDAQHAQAGDRWLVLLCGLPGDGDHRERLTGAVENIAASAESVFHVSPERVKILVGDEAMVDSLKGTLPDTGICDRDSVAELLQKTGKRIKPQDSCWFILLGHAQLYAGRSTFNVQGRDFDASELSKWIEPIQCNERVFLLTMPVSGYWLKPLRGPKTVLIAATEADLEYTATEMPYALADVVSGRQETQALEDIDEDGQLSLFDLYLAASLEVHARFKTMERLQTEHSQLDDNGDGIGKELQTPFLPSEEEDVAKREPKKPTKTPLTVNSDGDYSKSISIGKPPTRVQPSIEK